MKTIEEESRLYAESKANPMFRSLEVSIAEKAFKAGVEFAQRWISVEDELPEIGDDIILKLREHPLKKYQVWHIADNYDIKLVPVYATHWRPIELK